MSEGNTHGEKHVQIEKAEFTTQGGDNHRETLTKKICTKKHKVNLLNLMIMKGQSDNGPKYVN